MINDGKFGKRKMDCSCAHPKGKDGLHLCYISPGLTHDYCCAPIAWGDALGMVVDHCQCRVQEAPKVNIQPIEAKS